MSLYAVAILCPGDDVERASDGSTNWVRAVTPLPGLPQLSSLRAWVLQEMHMFWTRR